MRKAYTKTLKKEMPEETGESGIQKKTKNNTPSSRETQDFELINQD